jgi:putative ABC transport system permease protein
MRMQIMAGREFLPGDLNPGAAVVNQTFARKYLGSDNPIGQRVGVAQLEKFPDPVHDPWFEIIGVVADAKNHGLQDPVDPELWLPYTITGSNERGILVRTVGEPLAMLNAVRQEIWATDRSVALTLNGTLEGYISQFSYAGPRRFFLLGIFATIGLVLVTIGVYSVLAYTAARRTHEIGIRMALGAERGDVLKLVINMGLRLVMWGVAIGLAASLGVARVIATQLWGVSAYDPVTLTAVPLLLLFTGLVACWVPARRAARVDPLVALRYE